MLLFFPIQDSALHAKYNEHYTVDEQINGFDYIIHTLYRRKSKRLFHIIVLKEYHT